MQRQYFKESFFSSKAPTIKPVTDRELLEKYSNKTYLSSLQESTYKILKESNKANTTINNLSLDQIVENSTNSISQGNIYMFPVSRFDTENANKRTYPYELFQNVINGPHQEWKGQVGLADHPSDEAEASFKDAAFIWHGLYLPERYADPEKIVWAYGSPLMLGWGKVAMDVLANGGRVGFSSAGSGTYIPNSLIVDPNTFVLDRVADVVLNPSQNVYMTQEQLEQQKEALIKNESINKSYYQGWNPIIKESSVDDKVEEPKEEKVIVKVIENTTPVNKEALKLQLEFALKDKFQKIKEEKHPLDRKKELLELTKAFDNSIDLPIYQDISEAITAADNQIYNELKTMQNLKDYLKESSADNLIKILKNDEREFAKLDEQLIKIEESYKKIKRDNLFLNKKLKKEINTKQKLREDLIEKTQAFSRLSNKHSQIINQRDNLLEKANDLYLDNESLLEKNNDLYLDNESLLEKNKKEYYNKRNSILDLKENYKTQFIRNKRQIHHLREAITKLQQDKKIIPMLKEQVMIRDSKIRRAKAYEIIKEGKI